MIRNRFIKDIHGRCINLKYINEIRPALHENGIWFLRILSKDIGYCSQISEEFETKLEAQKFLENLMKEST